jgi:hypothetical protein
MRKTVDSDLREQSTERSKVRKDFNRKHRIPIGEYVMTPDGDIGEFQGISTHVGHSRLNLTVLLYKIGTDPGMRTDDMDARRMHVDLPKKFPHPNKAEMVPVRFSLTDRPKVPKPLGGSYGGESWSHSEYGNYEGNWSQRNQQTHWPGSGYHRRDSLW